MSDEFDAALIRELLELNERAQEDRLYEMAINELELNELDKVAMAFAFEEAEGNRKRSRAFYPKHRVRRIRDALLQTAISLEEQQNRKEKELLEAQEVRKAKALKEESEKQEIVKSPTEKDKLFLIIIAISAFFSAMLLTNSNYW